jgi:hypothetical protein
MEKQVKGQIGYSGLALLFGENGDDQSKYSSTCDLLFLGLRATHL